MSRNEILDALQAKGYGALELRGIYGINVKEPFEGEFVLSVAFPKYELICGLAGGIPQKVIVTNADNYAYCDVENPELLLLLADLYGGSIEHGIFFNCKENPEIVLRQVFDFYKKIA